MTPSEKAQQAHDLLMQMLLLLDSQKETTWRARIAGLIAELEGEDGKLFPAGFERARSGYKTMTRGARNFGEYAVWLDDKSEQKRINQIIEDLQAKLWAVFGP